MKSIQLFRPQDLGRIPREGTSRWKVGGNCADTEEKQHRCPKSERIARWGLVQHRPQHARGGGGAERSHE